MRLLTYDLQLEEAAIAHVYGCFNYHESCRVFDRFFYGQNYMLNWNKNTDAISFDLVALQKKLFDEFVNFSPSDVNPYKKNLKAAHFTQAAWSSTRLLGCAVGRYWSPAPNRQDFYEQMIICNYDPTGHTPGKAMNLLGLPCSKCPKRTTCGFHQDYPNLCGGGCPQYRCNGVSLQANINNLTSLFTVFKLSLLVSFTKIK